MDSLDSSICFCNRSEAGKEVLNRPNFLVQKGQRVSQAIRVPLVCRGFLIATTGSARRRAGIVARGAGRLD